MNIYIYICGGIGIRLWHTYGPQYMYTCIRTRRPHKVIVSARSTLSYDVCLRHKAWDDRLIYKVYERRPRSQCVI